MQIQSAGKKQFGDYWHEANIRCIFYFAINQHTSKRINHRSSPIFRFKRLHKHINRFQIDSASPTSLQVKHKDNDRSLPDRVDSFRICWWANKSEEIEWSEWWELYIQLIRRIRNKTMTKQQKLYIIKQLQNNDFWVRRVSKELMMNYSTVNSIKVEYQYYILWNKMPYYDIKTKKRLGKAETKEIDWYVNSFLVPFTAKDIWARLNSVFNKVYSEDLIRRHMKEDLCMSYRKVITKPIRVDTKKLFVIRNLFWYKISKHIDEYVLLVNVDESSFNFSISNNRGWFKKGRAAEVFCSTFTGSWFMILAITSDGDYYAFVLSGRNSTIIYKRFLESFEFWLMARQVDLNRKIIVMQDRCQIITQIKWKSL